MSLPLVIIKAYSIYDLRDFRMTILDILKISSLHSDRKFPLFYYMT